jgi:NAD(P)-dependent dehydrogenase (short-subunit alcohol dehydrogenase family)
VAGTKKTQDESVTRVALVTGANRGIGLEIARQLARLGLRVVVGAREAQSGEEAARLLAGEGDVVAEALDVCDDGSVRRAIDKVVERFGRLDALVNNAGILIDGSQTASAVRLEDVEATLDTNVLGAWRVSQAAIPLMRAQRYGRIVNLSSGMGMLADLRDSGGGWPAYRLSKTALNALTLLLAGELARENVLVNSADPGWVRTSMGGEGAPRSVEQGADTPVWLATLPDDGPTGGFFRDRRRIGW